MDYPTKSTEKTAMSDLADAYLPATGTPTDTQWDAYCEAVADRLTTTHPDKSYPGIKVRKTNA